MMLKKYIQLSLVIIFGLLSFQKSFAQCFQIESILVDACGPSEGLNEMVRFKIGPTAQNTSNLSVTWPNNPWQGLVQNSTTAANTATLNGDILDAGGCGQLIEPTGGVLPANANVILVTSYNLDTALNSFGALTQNIYILYQNNPSTTSGHFANSGTGLRTLSISFGSCSDTVTYDRSLLIDINGNTTAADGATVQYTPDNVATYVNHGCTAPVDPFTVNAGPPSVNACAGATISLNGIAEGYTSVHWSAASGSFSSPDGLSTNYTLSPTATGTISLTLTATNICGLTITDIINVNVVNSITPTFAAVAPICSGAILAALPTTSINGITGTWSPALNNTATTVYTFTPNTGQCAVQTTLTITVNTAVTPTFTAVAPICSGAVLAPLPTTSNNGITGTWSPALNNTTTTVYTFTPNTGQCAQQATLTITVNSASTIPTFTAVTPICSGAALAPLPTTSNNGITGTWSPALNNITTTVYTFTPNTGQCAVQTTLTITVNTAVTPTFAAVAPICSGATLAALPTTSINGITGTWSPALNNTATTVYTFTPNTGQCAVQTTLTITVNSPSTVPTFASVAPICSGATLAALPTTSINGITGTWSPALNNTATTVYTFTPNVGQCAVQTTLTITVNTGVTPTFAAVAPICSGATLAALPTTSINGITGTWSPALNNTATTVYTFTPNNGQCAVQTTLTITVNTAVTPTFASVAPICSGTTLAALPTTSINGIMGTWSPALNNTATTVYTFTPNAGQCAVQTTLTITVNSPSTIPTFTAVAPICSGATLAPLPTTSINGIIGTWSPALNNTATTVYTFTPNTGQCAVQTTLTITVNTPSTVPTFTAVTPICSGGTLAPLPTTSINGITGTWSPALNNTATTVYTFTPNVGQCAVQTTLTITVNPPSTVPTFASVAPICSGATLTALPTTSNNGITGTWSPALNNTVTTVYTFTPNTGQCAVQTTVTITVNTTVTPTFTAVAPICAGAALAPLPTTSNNGITGTWSPALNNAVTTVYTFIPNNGQCAVNTVMSIVVSDIDFGIDDECIDGNYILRAISNADQFDVNDIFEWRDQQGHIVSTDITLNVTELLSLIENPVFPITYELTVQNTEGCSKIKTKIVDGIFCDIQRGITPNDDGDNDVFDLSGLGVAELKIFNRYGMEVNSFRNYTNQWGGSSNKGEELPDGTYFYVIQKNNGENVTGWIYILRSR